VLAAAKVEPNIFLLEKAYEKVHKPHELLVKRGFRRGGSLSVARFWAWDMGAVTDVVSSAGDTKQ
jgi:hypothetical protein